MKRMIALACLGFAFIVSAPVFAGDQQGKMKGCNKEAKESALKGDERKAFMSKCLKKDYVLKHKAAEEGESAKSADADATVLVKQQGKMKSCNEEAKNKAIKGEERKKFMSSCLKG